MLSNCQHNEKNIIILTITVYLLSQNNNLNKYKSSQQQNTNKIR